MPKKHAHKTAHVVATPNAPAAESNTTTAAPPAVKANGQPSQEQIRLRAYLLWEAAGKPAGDGEEFWFRAERELTSNN